MPKIIDACFEAIEVDNENIRADQKRMVKDIQKAREESTDLMHQLLQNMQQFQLIVCTRLEALEKKEQPNLQPTSSYRSAPLESRH